MRVRWMLFSFCLTAWMLMPAAIAQEEPRPMGWRPLFGGKNLDGWEGINSSTADDWKIVDGVLQCHGAGGGWIAAPGSYGNFRLQLEFRVSQGANSGIFLRAPSGSLTPHVEGLEIQILDDAAEQHADLDHAKRCGSLLLEAGPAKQASKKAGQWQKLAIECTESRVRVFLNEERVVDVDLAQSDPLGEHPGRQRTAGRIGIQDHGERVDFRNFYVRELP